MELSFSELKKRDVVNIVDGKSYGKMVDLTISFPKGMLTGITVPGAKRNCITKLFDNNKLFIEESKILKIGNDVILVDLRCGDACAPSVKMHKPPCPPKLPPEGNCMQCPPTDEKFFGGDDEY